MTGLRSFDRVGPGTDREAAIRDLAAENRRRHPEDGGDRARWAVQRLSVAFLAADLGHVVSWDPVSGISGVQSRWTCTGCGRAVLQRTPLDDPYGSALEERCPEEKPADLCSQDPVSTLGS